MNGSDDSDPTGAGDFEEFDVMQEPAVEEQQEVAIESLGGLGDSTNQLEALLGARDELEQRLMGLPGMMSFSAAANDVEPYDPANVVGVGIGEKTIGGVPTGQLAVKILVREKMPDHQVSSEAAVPRSLGGAVTDVEETGEIRAQTFTARRRPAPCGVSIGNCLSNSAGTLGCLVTRSGQLFLLSNNHVMALVNTSPLNAGICQPGRIDTGVCPTDIIARLTQFITINFAAGATNTVDCAIARTTPNLVDRRLLRPAGVLQPIIPGNLTPALNMLVQKSGRTTQYRRGIIDLINTTVNVSYAPLGGVGRFARQFRVKGIGSVFSDRGDSGSLITSFPQNQPVGLLFAGNAAQNQTFGNPIAVVLSSFGVTIVT